MLARQHPDLILEQAREVLMLRSLHALREINTLRAAAETPQPRIARTGGGDAARCADRRVQPRLSRAIPGARIRQFHAATSGP